MKKRLKNKFNLKEKYIIIGILMSIFLFHLINNLIFLSIDTRPTAWDSSWHSAISLSYYNKITGKGQSDLSNVSRYLYEHSIKYPHFFHISSLPLTLLFGMSDDILVMTNIFYLLILIIFTYLLGKEVYSSKIGLLAAFIVTMYPMNFTHSRMYMIDYSLGGLVVASFYFLIKLKNSESLHDNIKYLILLILFLVIGAFTKQIFSIFLILPCLYVFILKGTLIYKKVYKKSTRKIKIISLSSLIILFLVLLVVINLYLSKISGYYLIKIIHNQISSSFSVFIYRFIILFVRDSMINNMMSFVLFLVFLYSFFHIDKFKEKTIFFLWLFFSMFFLVLTEVIAGGRYILPILPATAILSALGAFSIKNKIIRNYLIIFIIIFSFTLFFDISYSSTAKNYSVGPISLYANKAHTIDSIAREDWKINDILDYIKDDTEKDETWIMLANDVRWFNIDNFAYYNYKKNYYDLKIDLGYYEDPDYIIIKDAVGNVEGDRYNPLLDSLMNSKYYCLSKNINYSLLKSYPLPDNTNALIFKKTNCSF